MPMSRESTIDVTHGDLKLHCTRTHTHHRRVSQPWHCAPGKRAQTRRVLQASLSANGSAHAVSALTRTRRGIGNLTRVYLGCAGTCFFCRRSATSHGAAERIMPCRRPLQQYARGSSWHVARRHGCLDAAVLSALDDVIQPLLVDACNASPGLAIVPVGGAARGLATPGERSHVVMPAVS